jgi:fatty-acyl-CoA synthase
MREQVIGRTARTRWVLHSARVLHAAGLIRPAHPIATTRQARELRRRGPLAGVVRVAARRWPGAIGLVDDRGALTFGELDRRSNALAWAWRGQGIRQDSAIGLLCRNHRGPVDAMLAAAKLGAQVVPLPTDLVGERLAAVVQREGLTSIVYDREFTPVVLALPDRVNRYLAWTGGSENHSITIDELIAAAPAHEPPQPAEPGGITLLGRGHVPRGLPCRIRPAHFAAQFLDRIPMPPGRSVLVAAPLARPAGLVPFLVALALGSTAVLAREAHAAQLLTWIVRYRCGALALTPAVLDELLAATFPVALPLRVVVSSGGVLSADLGNRARALLGDIVHNWYAPDESLLAAVATPADWRAAPGTVGRAPFGCRLVLCDADGKRVDEPGRLGTVHVGNLLAGRLTPGADPVGDGLVASGAVGHFDRAGRLFLDGRR